MKILLGVVLAIVTHQWWPDIPSLRLLVLALLIFVITSKFVSRIFLGFIIGCFIIFAEISFFEYKTSKAMTVGTDTTIAGKVFSLFTPDQRQTRVLFDIDNINGQQLPLLDRFKVQLYWKIPQDLKQGQYWQLKVRIREPYGKVNEAGFDSERFFLAQNINAKGSVLSATLLENTPSLRQRLFDKAYTQLHTLPYARYLMALGFGDRSLLTATDWHLLQRSGLAHLLAISGLHIGLAFLFGFSLMRVIGILMQRQQAALYLPIIGGLCFALAYAWAAGFSLTVQRALLALLVFSLIRQKGYSIGPFSLFFVVVSLVLAIDPFSVFSMSFWFSFSAVFILCSMSFFSNDKALSLDNMNQKQGYRLIYPIRKYLILLFKVQCFLFIGMFPLMVFYFKGISLNAMLFNFFAIPLLSFCTVPLILLALMSSAFFNATMLWSLADTSLKPLFYILNQFDGQWLTLNWLSFRFSLWLVFIAFMVYVIKLRAFKCWVLIALISLIFWQKKPLDKDKWQVDVFDIGHGLAVLIEKNGEAVLYDTGAAWGKATIAQQIIAPVLRQRAAQLKGVIISHYDNDHVGGLTWIRQQLKPAWIRTSKQDTFLPCVKGQSWQWQGLSFVVLHPKKAVAYPKNKDSCVVRVFDGKNALLLTGDLPKKQEIELVDQQALLSSNLLIVPHHGSKTSSSNAFIKAVNPQIAIVSVGRYTPWDLPSRSVIARYQSQNIAWYETRWEGQMRVNFSKEGYSVYRFRFDLAPYWYRKKFGSQPRKRVDYALDVKR